MIRRPSAGDGGLRGNRQGVSVDLRRPKFTVLHVPGAGFIVLNPEEQKCSACFKSKDAALTLRDRLQAEADRQAKRGPRACLCCQQVFDSAGIHNRLCPSCKGRDQQGSPHAMVLPRRRTS